MSLSFYNYSFFTFYALKQAEKLKNIYLNKKVMANFFREIKSTQ